MDESYYNTEAVSFFNDTAHVDMSDLYAQFLPLLPTGGTILDAGCGSGRDSLAFIQRGFAVTAFDASHQLAALATAHTGLTVSTGRFLDFESTQLFDGIWACASLLHLPYCQLTDNLNHLAQYLTKDGYFYCSFKYGEGETERGGRHFTNFTQASLNQLLAKTELVVFKLWTTEDRRPARSHELWLNAILRHKQ